MMKLTNVLDLPASIGLHEAILRQVQNAGGARLDASDVEVMTLPCLQIILAAKRDAKIWIDQPSDAFVAAFQELGLDWSEGMSEVPLPLAEEPAPAEDAPPLDAVAELAQPAVACDMPAPIEPMAAPVPEESAPAAQPDLIEESMAAVSNIRILTIDDSKTMRDMLMLTLVDAGFDVLQAVDGQDGVDLAERENFDIVITDINMPRMDGYEVIRQLRKRPEHQATPILVLTTESETDKKTIAREAGATGWLVKPFDPDKLIATVRKVAG